MRNQLRLLDDPLNVGYRHRRPGFYDADAVSNDTATDFLIDEVVEGRRTGKRVKEESLTDQSGREDADINCLIRKFGINSVKATPEQMEALSSISMDAMDYRESLDRIREAQEAFNDLPAEVRKEFDNDPAKYLEAFGDEKKKDLLKRLGLVPEVAPKVDSEELVVLKEIRDAQKASAGVGEKK